MSKEFKDILDTCIDRIILKGESVEQCLESYPDWANELEPLLREALYTREAFSKEPRSEFQRAAKSRFMLELTGREDKKRGSILWGWQRQWAMAVAAVLAVIVMCGGTVGASTSALPGDLLYPVKTSMEKVQTFFTFGDEDKANLYIKLAERRIDEIQKLSENQRNIPDTVLNVMSANTDIAYDLANQNVSSQGELVAKIVNLTVNQKRVLMRLIENAPVEAKIMIRNAIERSENTYDRAQTIRERLQRQEKPQISPQDVSPSQATPIPAETGTLTSSGHKENEAENTTPTPDGQNNASADTPSLSPSLPQGTATNSSSPLPDSNDGVSSCTPEPQKDVHIDASADNQVSSLGSDNKSSDGIFLSSLSTGH
ncbi:MAG: DUF5667 domain-containing protein [Dehalococcoidia bacterium]|nr:DUF5667 domain-containing protein [Dehalococcoidia bacterium]